MIPQWENKVMSSMLLFVDHEICDKGQAYKNHTGTFYPIDSKYNGYFTYALPFKQIVGDASLSGATIMQGVSVDGTFTAMGSNNLSGIIYNKGQVLFDADKSNKVITGSFSVKEYNTYLSAKLEEQILFKTKYRINPTTAQVPAGLTNVEETYPAIFLKNMGGTNIPLGFGGVDNVKTLVRAVILSDSSFSLDAVCNILKNTAKKHLPIIGNLPFNSIGAFTGVIYNYQSLSSSTIEYGTIWNVTVAKLAPSVKDLEGLESNVFSALVDFEIHGFGKNI